MHSYAELHCQSVFSLMDGASTPEALLEYAEALGLHALALTDFTDLGGVVRFAERAKTLSLKAIIGNQFRIDTGIYRGRIVLLVQNGQGYENLCQLITLARMNCHRGLPVLSLEQLSRHSEGLYCLTGGPRGPLYRAIYENDQLGCGRVLSKLRAIFNDRLAVEVVHHGLASEMDCALASIKQAQTFRIPWVITNDVRYTTPSLRPVYDTLCCLKNGVTINQAGDIIFDNAEWFLKSPQQMWRRWPNLSAGLTQSVDIANQCDFTLDMLDMPLPEASIPSEYESAPQYLRALVKQGMQSRWGNDCSEVHTSQLDKELELICRRSLVGYFLIMWEIVSFAKRRGILVQGRGSAANSAVCYVLGITAVDPIAHQLLFERFLSDAREGYPDIDLDIEHARREELIQFVYQRYGRDKAAMVCAHQCFKYRASVRDVARVLEFSVTEADQLAKLSHRNGGLSEAGLEQAGWSAKEHRLKALIEVSNLLRGMPRHRGTHSGGFILSAQPISHSIPIEPAAMQGRSIIQWDKEDLEAIKIPKFDLLGLGILTAISRGLMLIRQRYNIDAYLYRLPQDKGVYEMLGRADTVGVFQVESRAQMNSLPRTRPTSLYELAIQVALIRPGPLQGDMVHPYIRRKRGEEAVEQIHPSLDPILQRTLGVPLFQEQGMRLAVEVAGFSPTDAERLRRAIGSSRSRDTFPELLEQLDQGLSRRGIPAHTVKKLMRHIAAFATYGFPESHSTSFALLVYASAWIKYFYPAEFLVALLQAQPLGFYAPDTLISDAKRHGVDVVSPCLKRSRWFTYIDEQQVILGLRWVKGLGRQAKLTLEKALHGGPLNDVESVFRRCHLSRSAWLTLVGAGAFRALISGDRRQAAWVVLRHLNNRQLSLDLKPTSERKIDLGSMSSRTKMEQDYLNMGLSTGAHPMSFYREQIENVSADSVSIKRYQNGQKVRVAGVVIARQRPETAKGFCFISLEDEYGFLNIIVSPKCYERYWRVITEAQVLVVEGMISARTDELNIKAVHLSAFEYQATQTLPRSYDFK